MLLAFWGLGNVFITCQKLRWEESAYLGRFLEQYDSADTGQLWGAFHNGDSGTIDLGSTFGKADSKKKQNLAAIFDTESFTILWLQTTEMNLANLNGRSNSLQGYGYFQNLVNTENTDFWNETRIALAIQVFTEIQTKE